MRCEFSKDNEVVYVYDYAYVNMHMQQLAIATYEFREMQAKFSSQPKTLDKFLDNEGTITKARMMAYLLRKVDPETGDVHKFSRPTAETKALSFVLNAQDEDKKKLEEAWQDFLGKSGHSMILLTSQLGGDFEKIGEMLAVLTLALEKNDDEETTNGNNSSDGNTGVSTPGTQDDTGKS